MEYPCIICQTEVTEEQQAIVCDSCNRWQHRSCGTGITAEFYLKIQLDPSDTETLEKIKKDRGYSFQDLCDIRRETLPNYDEKLKHFYREHIHSDEEIRFCIEGSGYFDARDVDDRWVRIEFVKGDLLIMPAGIYHRFTLDQSNYIKVYRFFVGEPVWTPINRPAEEHPARQSYVETFCRKG